MINIVDSHCHLDFKDFQDDLDLVIKNAYNANVKHMLSISVNLEDFNNVYKVANSYDNIYCTTGIHPNNVPENKNNELLFEKLSLKFKQKKKLLVLEKLA